MAVTSEGSRHCACVLDATCLKHITINCAFGSAEAALKFSEALFWRHSRLVVPEFDFNVVADNLERVPVTRKALYLSSYAEGSLRIARLVGQRVCFSPAAVRHCDVDFVHVHAIE
ncbi:hypothetical protein SAMN05446935_0338 [Burkholderia sp. YR290]|nr:hypothetical protein SAMN05446935_0338 [Burkholderia sp. YR290]